MERTAVAIVGAGHAGLSVSHELAAAGIDHVMLERGRIGETWRRRWDTFCLVTPNWSVRLPGRPYGGPDPDGFMVRDEIVAYLEEYARSFGAPVREGVTVASVRSAQEGGFSLRTTAGDLQAAALVIASGANQRARRPRGADTLPADLPQFDVTDYTSEHDLPPGRVLIVGSGQSGAQIAEELCEAGREVVLACGKVGWMPRRILDRDIFWWLAETGFLDEPPDALSAEARLFATPLVTGHRGGHDLHLRTLHAMGVTLAGHFLEARRGQVWFAPDLQESIDWGDERHRELMNLIRHCADEHALPLSSLPEPERFSPAAPDHIALSSIGAVIFAVGFRPDYRSWLPWPQAFDDLGYPLQRDGACTLVPGLFFTGVPFLRTRKSSSLFGAAEDAAVVARLAASALTR